MSSTGALLARADNLVADGRTREAIAVLTDANRRDPEPAIERLLARLRLAAWSEMERGGPPPRWDFPVDDIFSDESAVPEVAAEALTANVVRSAIRHHGALVVRGLFPEHWCARLRDDIDRSWEAIERFRETKLRDPAWFDPLDTDDLGLNMAARLWVIRSGTSYVPDSPRLLFDFVEALDAAGMKQIATEYFGEPPVLSVVKLAQRRLAADACGGWHQDAAVYGIDARTLNLWVPVSRCGDVAPGLDIWPRRLDYLVKTVGTKGVAEFTAVESDVAELTAQVPVARPVFEPGDAAIFDQYLLHQTAASQAFTEPRYGFESWFFAASTYPDPDRWIPIVY